MRGNRLMINFKTNLYEDQINYFCDFGSRSRGILR